MAEQLQIRGGHNGHDPMQVFMAEARSLAEQDPAVVERCPGIFSEASNLVLGMSGDARLEPIDPTHRLILQTPKVGYVDDSTGQEAAVHLELAYDLGPLGSLAVDHSSARATLVASAEGVLDRPLLQLSPGGILRNVYGEMRPAGHGSLNFFRIVVDRIHSQAFPKDMRLEVERRCDRVADGTRARATGAS